MKSGRLRHRITVQSPTQTTDDRGGPKDTWATYATRWASVEPLSAREFFGAQQMASEITHKITLRHDSVTGGVNPKMRVSWDSRVFDIESVMNTGERDRELILMARERL